MKKRKVVPDNVPQQWMFKMKTMFVLLQNQSQKNLLIRRAETETDDFSV